MFVRFSYVIVFVILIGLTSLSLAESSQLEGFKDGICTKDFGITNSPSELAKRQQSYESVLSRIDQQNRIPSCFIDAKRALQQHKLGKARLIDVRSKSDFQRYHLKGSLNIAPHTLKNKTFLKSKKIVLIDNGHSSRQLENYCLALRDAGFSKTYVLNGGLSHFANQKHQFVGDRLATQELTQLSASLFFQEKNDNNWLVLDNSKNQQATKHHIVKENIIDGYNFQQFLTKRITTAIKNKKALDLPVSLVIVEKDEAKAMVLRNTLIQQFDINVLILSGGWQSYDRFLNQQARIWESKHMALNRKTGCGA